MHPILSTWLILLWALVALALMLYGYRNKRLSKRRVAFLMCLESLCMLALLLVFLQPLYKTQKPKEGAYRVVMLGDMSRSMSVRDLPDGRSRRECLASLKDDGHFKRVEKVAFASEMKRVLDFEGSNFLPGSSPIGSHLESILDEEGHSLPLGALVLFSDGVRNGGADVLKSAKEYRHRGIPISCVGIGGSRKDLDYGVTWKETSLKVQRDTDCRLTALVSGTKNAELNVDLSEAGIVLEQRSVSFQGGTIALEFSVKPRTEGFHAYKVSVRSPEEEARLDNNAAFAAVEVIPPPVFSMLALLGGLDWEQRFINQFSASNPQFTVSVITAVSDQRFIAMGFPENVVPPENSFPQEATFYDDFDIVCLDARAIPLLGENGIRAIRAFVENKGGGLLVRGPLSSSPTELAELLPARETQLMQSAMPMKLQFSQNAVFGKEASPLLAFGNGIFLKQVETLEPLLGLKKSARPMALLSSPQGIEMPLVAGFPFGAGRVVMTGLESTWRWRLAGNKLHDAWWTSVLQWLAAAAKPRVRELNGRLAEAGQEYALELSVLDDEFRPAANATVSARIRCPNGAVQEIALDAAADEEGRYSALFYPDLEGEYRVQYSIALPERTLTKEAFFVASPAGREMEDTAFNEALLRDVARITGGRYFTIEDYAVDEIPLSSKIPLVTSTKYLASTWVVALVFSCSAMALCFFRRRFGLR